MTVVLNEAAITALFHSEPIRQELERVGDVAEAKVVERLTVGTDPLLHSYPGDVNELIESKVEQDSVSLYAAVGVIDTGKRLAQYVKIKEEREHKWFQAVIDEMRVAI